MKIFLAEDNEDNYIIVKSNLKKIDSAIELVRVQNGEEAITLLAAGQLFPDLLLIDIAMPKINGLELIRWIKEQHHLREIPSIALTASVFAEMKESYKEHGFTHILEKPFTRQELLEILKKTVG